MLGLQLPTDPRWAELVKSDLRELLTDHAWCEMKAASNVMSMMVRYPDLTELVAELTRICQEEVEHFGQVHQKIVARGWTLGPERKDHYVNELLLFVRTGGNREERLGPPREARGAAPDAVLDAPLRDHVGHIGRREALAVRREARSCERFKMLSEEAPDQDLREFYRDLMISEAGHYTTFIGFARRYGGRVDVDARWKQFLAYEAQVITRYGTAPTMHG